MTPTGGPCSGSVPGAGTWTSVGGPASPRGREPGPRDGRARREDTWPLTAPQSSRPGLTTGCGSQGRETSPLQSHSREAVRTQSGAPLPSACTAGFLARARLRPVCGGLRAPPWHHWERWTSLQPTCMDLATPSLRPPGCGRGCSLPAPPLCHCPRPRPTTPRPTRVWDLAAVFELQPQVRPPEQPQTLFRSKGAVAACPPAPPACGPGWRAPALPGDAGVTGSSHLTCVLQPEPHHKHHWASLGP